MFARLLTALLISATAAGAADYNPQARLDAEDLSRARTGALIRLQDHTQYRVVPADTWGIAEGAQIRVCGVVQTDAPGFPRHRFITFKRDNGSPAFEAEWQAKCVRPVEQVRLWPGESWFPILTERLPRALETMRNALADANGSRSDAITVPRETFTVIAETQAICGTFVHALDGLPRRFAWYNGQLDQEGTDAFDARAETVCSDRQGSEVFHRLTFPENAEDDYRPQPLIGLANAVRTVPWDSAARATPLLGLDVPQVQSQQAPAPPVLRPAPRYVQLPPVRPDLGRLGRVAARVQSVWAVPAELRQDPGFYVTFGITMNELGQLTRPPRLLEADAQRGSPGAV